MPIRALAVLGVPAEGGLAVSFGLTPAAKAGAVPVLASGTGAYARLIAAAMGGRAFVVPDAARRLDGRPVPASACEGRPQIASTPAGLPLCTGQPSCVTQRTFADGLADAGVVRQPSARPPVPPAGDVGHTPAVGASMRVRRKQIPFVVARPLGRLKPTNLSAHPLSGRLSAPEAAKTARVAVPLWAQPTRRAKNQPYLAQL